MRHLGMATVCVSVIAVLLGPAPTRAGNVEPEGVFEYVVRNSTLNLDDAAAALEHGLRDGPFGWVRTLDATSPDDCSYRAKVFVVWNETYAAKLRLAQPETFPFAVSLRVELFEDEDGVHASIVNPTNINRTGRTRGRRTDRTAGREEIVHDRAQR